MALHRFDHVLAVDWSAANRPTTGKDSCWLGLATRNGKGATVTVSNPPTRRQAVLEVRRCIEEALASRKRILVGFDASLGYPLGTLELLGVGGPHGWWELWDLIADLSSDSPLNENNRFEVAEALNRRAGEKLFWAKPNRNHYRGVPFNLEERGAVKGVGELRTCEEVDGATGMQSGWKLNGAGSVGGQALTLIPYLRDLCNDYHGEISVWPFEGWGDPGSPVVLAEMWFSHRGHAASLDALVASGMVRDEAQVRLAGTRLVGSTPAQWARLFAEPSALARSTASRVGHEEGWTLEVGVC